MSKKQIPFVVGQYAITAQSKNAIQIEDTKNNKTIFIDDSTREQLIHIHKIDKFDIYDDEEDSLIHACKQDTNKRLK
tara:strand:+ start:148 stop:378 length:231 start_codon:yes stop_codon:yes gene_type:complete